MKSNVSKFLVKSILSTAVAATVTSGFVCGSEDARYICPLCKKIGYGTFFFKIHDDHVLCMSCMKKRVKNGNQMCFCGGGDGLSSQELSEIENWPNDLTDEQKEAVANWNENRPITQDAFFDLYASLIGGKETPFKDEKEFIACGLGICYDCYAIIARPKELNEERIKEVKNELKVGGNLAKFSLNYFCKSCSCGKKNIAKSINGKQSALLVPSPFKYYYPINN